MAAEAKGYKDDGFKAMKLRFGWGPVDGAEGMQRNLDLVRTVRDTVGNDVDVMADAYMGWTLDYAKRMLPLLGPFQLRWLEEPVIPDDIETLLVDPPDFDDTTRTDSKVLTEIARQLVSQNELGFQLKRYHLSASHY